MSRGESTRAGISFTYPSRWRVTKPLSNGVEPIYRFALSTFPVRRFYLWISTGPEAPPATKLALRHILDGMRIVRNT